jgi:uncharacterized protein YjeT (DUF2065 family)
MHQGRTETLAVGLGLFSIALGLTEIVAPRLVRRAADMRCSDNIVRLCGVREVVNGVGILVSWKRAPWIWARVAGDAMDIAATRRPAALVALAGVTAVDVAAAAQLSREENRAPARRFDYSDRSGFPRSIAEMRGAARTKKERTQGPPSFDATVRV